ncbi:MAG: biotin--[Clostridia bacterium]|nr:biotin--[acetyl-CoA-carboxylase] ligase [Clostridia bacterium]
MENIIRLSSVDSTNHYAKELAREGAVHKTLVMADEQTQGRGRRGRGWISPAGEGIFMSLILRPDMPPEQVPMISLHTAVAVCLAISRVTGLEAKIKWPNDIVLSGRKVCGMLLEMDADAQQVRSVVAGIGINVHQTQFPQEIAHTASSLDLLCGRRLSRMDVVRAFLA